tara:strand:+ start:11132 stop:11881 length:750 start_codon:yes stop_codon:yes gene_type:complete
MTTISFEDIVQQLNHDSSTHSPYCIGIVGAPASGKSTLAALLKEQLQISQPDITISTVPLDNFIHNNQYLRANDLMSKKGFPCSFNGEAGAEVIRTIHENKQGLIKMPWYSHDIKDIHPHQQQTLSRSDVYIFEGVSLFYELAQQQDQPFIFGDQMQSTIFLDTDESITKQRALARFFSAYEQAKCSVEPPLYFIPLLKMSREAIEAHAEDLWQSVDVPLIEAHIDPQRSQATYCVEDVPFVEQAVASS